MTKTNSTFLDTCIAHSDATGLYQRIESRNHCNDIYVAFHEGSFTGPLKYTATVVAGKVTYPWGAA